MLVGIDLGTTNSAVAIWRDSEAELVPNALGDVLTPSAVSVDKSGQTWIGASALDRFATHPGETVTSFKRMMGTEARATLGKRDFSAEELSAMVLVSLMDDVEAALGERPTEAVITVPAYFNERQRRATRRAGEIAGLDVKRLINEPTAAALAFGLTDRGDQEPFLVFDLGGGTFDVSIVEMFEGIVEVRASAGDNRLGGDDFNAALVALAQPRLDADDQLAVMPADRKNALLTQAAEQCRRALTTAHEADFSITINDQAYTTRITTEEFEETVEPLIRRLRDPVLRSLRDTGIDVKSLSEVVLVGGSTRMPVVRKALTRMFGRFPNHTVHPDHAVALGAAVQAGLLSNDEGLEEIRITDVAPFTLGIDSSDEDAHGQIHSGIFSPIIERNTPVPVSRMQVYSTMQANQTRIEMGVYQGEARDVKNNVKLGGMSVRVPAKPRGEEIVEVRFTYDTSGLLEVDVHVPSTGLTKNLVIVDEEDKRSKSEIASSRKALEKLKTHPRDEAENIAAMARAERCYEGFTGDVRDAIGRWITAFKGALDKQDPRIIADARKQLLAALDEIEANPPL
ncbi:Hsp70 family protein [Pontixanthobacter aestiaquae]|uniref:Hsp70 family protein n=1 Tax=Pontixanthobacter aestiaquae TaxID=1509367 RepID=A0A844Z589_9SPHN|nr:Hsp70 family protein [Pontixanthobacter aestiaquae]MDN3647032.1 Hsp70 family protein [Pontixanthobacter aestiaquae]MXO81990.1 Hsp70 family protein [Pontixanthobacter aestiaquae]